MIKKRLLLVLGIVLFIVLAALLVFVGVSYERYSLPTHPVENQTFYHENGLFLANDIYVYPTRANVSFLNLSDSNIKVGISAQPNELNFGNVPQGVIIRKSISLTNNEKVPIKLCIINKGTISPYLRISPSEDFVLVPGETSSIGIAFNSTSIATYSGELDLVLRKPRYDILEYFISSIGC